MATKKEDKQAFSVNFPKSLIEEIDQICAVNCVSRTSWLVKAARTLLEHERMKSKEDILAKLTTDTEKQMSML
ncbi:MAG: hypothetical protein V4485_05080 [Pseudomonadota bacterium]